MPTVGIAQPARAIVVLAKKGGGIRSVGSVVIKQRVDRAQKTLRVVPGEGTLTAQVGLQVGHQQCTRNPVPGDVAEHQPESFLAETEEVIVVPSDLASLNTNTGIVQRLE